MKPEKIKLSDWQRILFGQVPAEFYLELIIRGLLIYVLLITCMRLLGKRMSGSISRLELAALVSLASAVGVPLLSPMNGVLPAFIIALIIVLITRSIRSLSAKSEKFENITQGELDTLVQDGVMRLNIMKRVRVSRERLFSQLRSENQTQLGAVKRLYMEANGGFSLIPNEEPAPGLLLLPDWDDEFVNEKVKRTNVLICKECGAPIPVDKLQQKEIRCNNCGADDWTKAVIEK